MLSVIAAGIEDRSDRTDDFNAPGWPEADLFTALRESLGLKLERHDVQVQFLLIDHIERIPTEN